MADPKSEPEKAAAWLRMVHRDDINQRHLEQVAVLIEQMRAVVEQATLLERGCQCGYDDRCSNCQRIVDVKELAQRALQGG